MEVARKGSLCLFVLVVHRIVKCFRWISLVQDIIEPDLRRLSLSAIIPLSWIAFVMSTSSERRKGRKSLAMQTNFNLNRDYLIRFHHHSSRLLCQQATRGKRDGNLSPCCNLESYHYLLQPTTCWLCDQKTTPKQCRWKVQSKKKKKRVINHHLLSLLRMSDCRRPTEKPQEAGGIRCLRRSQGVKNEDKTGERKWEQSKQPGRLMGSAIPPSRAIVKWRL